MVDNKLFKFILLFIAVVILIFFIFFEIKEVPDITHKSDYNVESKASGDLYLFNRLLEETYKDSHTIIADSLDYLASLESNLFVYIDRQIDFDDATFKYVFDYVEAGNEAIIISSNIDSDNHYAWGLETDNFSDSLATIQWNDGTTITHENKDSIFNYRYTRSYSHLEYPYDSLHADYIDLAMINDSLPMVRSYRLGKGQLVLHTFPELFLNISSQKKDYYANFYKTFCQFDSDNVTLHQYPVLNKMVGKNKDSPIQYILDQPALRNAYYGLLLTALIFVIFASKRKQKIIPTLVQNRNTSIEYVQTMSELHKAQDQNEKLVPQMEKIFYHKIKSKYFLHHKHPEYAQLLSLKSKVPIAEINKILTKFDSAKSHDFSDDQLINLHNDIISFHKKSS